MWPLIWHRLVLAAILVFSSCVFEGYAADNDVTLRVKIHSDSTKPDTVQRRADESEVVVWLRPVDPPALNVATSPGEQSTKRPRVVQKDKSFQPHLTVVPVGSLVDFPNHDPFFHNVFSLFNGKRFDLGLYEAGTSNSVRFDHAGVSYIFCNIHPEMSAVVVAVDTPYYGVSDKSGNVTIPNVPDGKYEMHVWYERSLADALKGLTRAVSVSTSSRALGTVVVEQDPGFTPAHKNKYGRDYSPPPKQGYPQP